MLLAGAMLPSRVGQHVYLGKRLRGKPRAHTGGAEPGQCGQPAGGVLLGALVQHAAQVVLGLRLLRHLLQPLGLPHGQAVVLQLNPLRRAPQSLGNAGLLQAVHTGTCMTSTEATLYDKRQELNTRRYNEEAEGGRRHLQRLSKPPWQPPFVSVKGGTALP